MVIKWCDYRGYILYNEGEEVIDNDDIFKEININ